MKISKTKKELKELGLIQKINNFKFVESTERKALYVLYLYYF